MFELMNKVASNNKISPNLRALRIVGKTGIATDNVMTFVTDNLPTENLDCLIDNEAFITSWKSTKAPKYSQHENTVLIDDGKFKTELVSFESKHYPITSDHVPQGASRESGDLLEQLANIIPFAPENNTFIVVMGEHVYTMGTMAAYVVRSKLNVDFGNAVVVTKAFAQLMIQVGEPLVDFLVGMDTITAVFEHCWIELARPNINLPKQMDEIFQEASNLTLELMDAEILATLGKLCQSAKKDELVKFGPDGISLQQKSGNAKWSLDLVTKPFVGKATFLKLVLGSADRFCFDDPMKLYFAGSKVEGFLATVSTK